MLKGQWEKMILASLNRQAAAEFKKRPLDSGGETFELDAASPIEGPIAIGVDVKRIEARRDIHKRCDEIVNKATMFKTAYPEARFVAVVYYPFTAQHVNVQHRLQSSQIDHVFFASHSQEQIAVTVGLMVHKLGIRRRA